MFYFLEQKRPILQTIFSGLITSKMRIRILMRLFLNPNKHAYLRELASEFDASPSQVKEELRHLSEVGLLESEKNGRHINYRANKKHVLFPELHSMVKKALGMDQILESIIKRLGNLEEAFLMDDYAEGKDTGIIDLLLVGEVNQKNLTDLVGKTEQYIGRKIRTLAITCKEYEKLLPRLKHRHMLSLWKSKSE